MFDVFKYLSDLTARAHMLEGTINKKTGKFYTKEEIAETLGLMNPGGVLATDFVLHEIRKNDTVSNPKPEGVAENDISDDSDDEIKEDEQ